jgi:dTDP-4-dehydrorhamnose 3,5-epimerase
MKRFTTIDLPLSGLKRIHRNKFEDARGFFSRLFCAEEMVDMGWTQPICQINHTFTTKRGTVRGMHFQRSPYAEMKLITCISGEVLDVALDLRSGSSTFMKWEAQILSAQNNLSLLIPKGFAHGFQALTEDVEIVYLHSNRYEITAEAGLNPQDKVFEKLWPLPISEISERDLALPMLDGNFEGVQI